MGKIVRHELYTVGYEGLNIEQFIDRLKKNRINRIIDVREIPLSRKKGFSKKLLTKKLQNEGIEYLHMKELGSPRDIRKKLKEDGNYNNFFKKFSKYLSGKQHVIEDLYEYIIESVSCLMCFERLAKECHRSIVAESINGFNSNNILIKHI